MPVPSPKSEEEKQDFISRCIRTMAKKDPDTSKDKRAAMCFSKWRDSKNE